MSFKRILITAPLLVLSTGCQKESSPPLKTETPPQQAKAQVTLPSSSSSVISVTPSSLQNCDQGIEATVNWDASRAKATTENTEIWVGADANSMKLFSAGGSAGQTKTGPWTLPGTHFVLKNKQNGAQLGEAIVGGPACN